MTEQEEKELREFSADLAATENSPWEPRCLMRAFATPSPDAIILTMQGWADLELIQSPILQSELPSNFEQLEGAAKAFGLSVDKISPDEGVGIASALCFAVSEGFALALPMRPPKECTTTPSGKDGFGAWLPLLTFLIKECGLSYADASAMDVRRAFALMAAAQRSEGWECAGDTYLHRDMKDGPAQADTSEGSEENIETSAEVRTEPTKEQ